MQLLAFLPSVKWADQYHFHICLLDPAASYFSLAQSLEIASLVLSGDHKTRLPEPLKLAY